MYEFGIKLGRGPLETLLGRGQEKYKSIRSCKGKFINCKFKGNVNDKNSNNDNGMKYLLVTLNCLSIAVTSAVQHVLHF